MTFEVPGARVLTSFTLSQPAAMARMSYAQDLQQGDHSPFAPIPPLNGEGFTIDVNKMTVVTPDMVALKRDVIGISDAYIWPARTFTLVLNSGEERRISGATEVDFLSAADLDLKNPQSIYRWVAGKKRTTYVPSTNFKRTLGFYCLPKNTSEEMAKNQTIRLEGFPDIGRMGIDRGSLVNRVAFHSQSAVFLPLVYRENELGMMAFTYTTPFIFGNPADGGLLDLNHLTYLHTLAEMTAFTIAKFQQSRQKSSN